MKMKKELLGYLIIKEPQEFTESFECAAWYRRVVVQPGKYEVYADYLGYDRPYYAVAKLPGVVTASNFSSYFGGVMVGKGKFDEEVGQYACYVWQTYAYNFAEMVASGDAEIADGFQIVPHLYTGYQGEPMTMYIVEKKPA